MREGAPGGKAVSDTSAIAPGGKNASSVVASVMMAATLRLPFNQIADRTSAGALINASALNFLAERAMHAPGIKEPGEVGRTEESTSEETR